MRATQIFYYELISKDRIGNRWTSYRKAEATSKTAIKNRYRGTGLTVGYIWTEQELEELKESAKENIKSKAI